LEEIGDFLLIEYVVITPLHHYSQVAVHLFKKQIQFCKEFFLFCFWNCNSCLIVSITQSWHIKDVELLHNSV